MGLCFWPIFQHKETEGYVLRLLGEVLHSPANCFAMQMTWLNCFTGDRYGLMPETQNMRSEFERDYDRIIFSSAFRRLQNKTQVFPLPEHVFVHNRLTHSLEVVSVGRSLAKIVGQELAKKEGVKDNPQAVDFYKNQLQHVIAAACLAHDLGNPAFGHSGEEAISKYFKDREKDEEFTSRFSSDEWLDLTNFEGNANALRILTRQFNGRLEGGYRLTYPTLASILKYPCESAGRQKPGPKHRSKFGFFQDDKDTFLEIAQKLHLKRDVDDPLCYFRHPFVYLVEAADDICYSIIDFEDAHRLGILSFLEVTDALMAIVELNPKEDIERVKDNLKNLKMDPNEGVAYLRAKAINYLVTRCSEIFMENAEEILAANYQGSLIKGCEQMQPVLKAIENESVAKIYAYDSVVKIELAGFKIMSGLIEDFVEAALIPKALRQNRHKNLLNLMPYQNRFDEKDTDYQKVMCILDHVSAMTDNYALNLYRNLRGISMPSI